ncbi:Mpv17/PMP22 family protein [Xylariales sp. AK1849]|nr:Mpv17/PMP22 family protein [Xylariales sp. AK1849]
MATGRVRIALRRQHDVVRLHRLPQPPRRFQSSGPGRKSQTVKEKDPIPVPATIAPLPLWQKLGPLSRAATAYARAQRARPYVTQVVSATVIYLFADISAQRISGKGHDPKRTARSLLIGASAAIPNYKRFIFLSHNFNYSSRILSIGTKVTINQIFFAPIFNSYFFGAQALLSGDNLEGTWERIKSTVPISMVNSLKLWPAVTAFSFTFVPTEYRSIFAGVIAVGWQTYLSSLNRQAEVKEARQKALGSTEMVRI